MTIIGNGVLFAALCIGSLQLVCASSLRSDSSNGLSIQQQFQIITAGARKATSDASEQSHLLDVSSRLRTPPQTHQKVFLLSIMQKLKSKQRAKAQQASHAMEKTGHEMKLVTTMAQLEHQLASVKHEENELEKQEEQIKGQDAIWQAVRTSQAAQIVWRHRNLFLLEVLSGMALAIAISICFFSMWPNKKNLHREVKRDAPVTVQVNQPEFWQPLSPDVSKDVSKHLTAMEDAVSKVKMPSEGAFQVALQAVAVTKDCVAMEVQVSENVSVSKEASEPEQKPRAPSPPFRVLLGPHQTPSQFGESGAS